jgi:PhnB protein
MDSNVRYIVDDVEAAIDFYRDRLGFDVESHPAPGFARLSRGGLKLLVNAPGAGGAGRAGGDPKPGGWNRVQLTVDDLQAVVNDLHHTDVKFRGQVVEGNGGKQIVVEDPSGNPVELFEPAQSRSVHPIPDDAQVLTPFLSMDDVAAFIGFVEEAFKGTAVYTMTSADGVVRHCRLEVGGCQLMVSSGTGVFTPMPCMLHLYIDDVDVVFRSALHAGARSLREPTDEFYGDRSAGVEDPWGNQWWLATHVEDVSAADLERREREYREQAHAEPVRGGDVRVPDAVEPVPERLHTVTARLVFGNDAAHAMRFYADAFGAEVLDEPYVAPDGKVVHGEVRIGDTVVFVSDEGDGGNGVAPTSVGGEVTAVMVLNIPDVDQLWERAVNSGCEILFPLADQFYGDRSGRLRDPFGHQWILSTHVANIDRDELDGRLQAAPVDQA